MQIQMMEESPKPCHISCKEHYCHHSTCKSSPNPEHITLLSKSLVCNKCLHELLHCYDQSGVMLFEKANAKSIISMRCTFVHKDQNKG